MRSYIDLNDEMAELLTIIENIENQLVDLLVPIYKSIDKYPGILSPVIPKNTIAISIKNIKNRLMILKDDIKITSRISEDEKYIIIATIDNVISQLFLIDEKEKEKVTKKIIELRILINKRKQYVEKKYDILKEFDLKIDSINGNDTTNNKIEMLVKNRNKIVADSDLCEDIRVLYDYKIKKIDNYNQKFNDVNTVDDLYKLVNLIIKNQISEVLKYRFLSKKKIRELKYKLKTNVSGYVSNYIIMNNNDLSKEIDNFSIILKNIINGELENIFEMKDKLGIEYIVSKDNKTRVITLKEVIENEDSLFEMNSINKFETILELSQVDECNIEKVRNFIIKMGPEFVSIFDNLWIQDNIKRRKKILEIKKEKKETINENIKIN